MSRWILLIIVALVVSYLIDSQAKRLRRRLDDLRGAVRPGSPPTRSAPVHTMGELVACANCGVHVLKQRSLEEGSRRFCSEACRQRSATTRS